MLSKAQIMAMVAGDSWLEKGDNLLVFGLPGGSKSHLAAAIGLSLIDLDRLNDGPERLSIVATDVETGEDVWFDTATDRIAADHLLAATALLPLFAPVECGGRLLCDAGLSNNLPLDRVLRGRLDAPTLCIAVDLFSACNSRPGTLDQSLTRTQDLVFALQSRRQIETLSLERQLRRAQDHASPPAVLAFMAYRARESEGALKALNFTGSVLAQRAAQGGRDMDRLLQALADAPRNEALALLVAEEGAEHSAEAPVAELVSRP